MAEVRFSLYCRGPDREIGQGWKLQRRQLPLAVALLMRCINGRWRGERLWEVVVYALDHSTGLQMDATGLQWTNEQRKWFERHMKKITEGEENENLCAGKSL
jgi:hypothetical protein